MKKKFDYSDEKKCINIQKYVCKYFYIDKNLS